MKIVILSFAIAALLGTASPSTSTGVSVSPSPTEAGKSIAREFLPGQTYRDCPDCPKIVVVPTGSFTMGSPANEPGRNDTERPQRKVNIRQFAVGTFDVTRGEWAAFVSATNRSTVGVCLGRALQWKTGSSGFLAQAWFSSRRQTSRGLRDLARCSRLCPLA
jgi:formylglycine-generating enzyme required for sulfatase activity